jgi:hypothetical protein
MVLNCSKAWLAFYIFLANLFFISPLHAQNRVTISGNVRDAATGEDLIGATVIAKGTNIGATTNAYGRYAITLPPGKYFLRISYIGYQSMEQEVDATSSRQLDIKLQTESTELKEVEIRADAPRNALDRTQMSKVDIPITKVKELPAIFGEVDVLKTLQLLPGVQSGNEGTTGFFVRGGGSDQNLIVLDEALVYNASHLFGFFSVFNSDAIKNVEFYKGGYPAKFGGRLSSVVDVNLKDGNNQKFSGAGGIGLIASRLTLEGPIKKGKSSYIISGRRTYFDVFTRAYNKSKKKDLEFNPIPDYYFYDLNAKVNFQLDSNDRLYLSGYFGRDVFGFHRDAFNFDFNWGNVTGTARWNHSFSPRLFMNTTTTYTNYNYEIANKFDKFSFKVGSNVQDYTLKSDLDYALTEKHYLTFGASGVYHRFGVGRLQIASTDNTFNINQNTTLEGTELGAYVSDDWDISTRWKLTYGLRGSGFVYKSKFYTGLEPRASVRYRASDKTSIKASFTNMNQYVHLVSNSAASLPTDIWYPSTEKVKPQISNQVATGVTTLLLGEKLLLTDEVYYKWMDRQIDFRDGAQLFLNPNLEQEFVFGKGWSYGNEIFLEKRSGKFTGWISYTLSWTYRKFDAINDGEKFFPKYDQRNNISVVGSYQFGKRLTVSATWVYGDGNAFSLASGYAFLNNLDGSNATILPYYEKRNDLRMPAYHRMDFAAVWKFFPKWGTSDLTFSVYNVYNRRNPFTIYINENRLDAEGELPLPNGATINQISLFPIIPSVTYNFKF